MAPIAQGADDGAGLKARALGCRPGDLMDYDLEPADLAPPEASETL